MRETESTHDEFVNGTERWFQRRGLWYTGKNEISPFVLLNRVIPVLVLTLIAEVITMSLNSRYRGSMLLGVFVLAAVGMEFVGLLLSSHRPRRRWDLPRWASVVVAALFGGSPTIIALVVKSTLSVVIVLLVVNLGVIAVAMLLEYYNVLPIVRHEFSEIRSGQRKFFPPMQEVLPILLIASTASPTSTAGARSTTSPGRPPHRISRCRTIRPRRPTSGPTRSASTRSDCSSTS